MNENKELQSGFPDWLTEDYKVTEPEFCRSFLREHPMRCIRGRFYTVDGLVADESVLKKEIYDQISPWLETKIARKVDELLNALRMAAYSEPIELECDRIHVVNGTLFLEGCFSQEKAYCNNRLTVSYRPDAPPPERWLRFLSEAAVPGGHPHLAGVPGLLPAPHHQGPEDADAHWQRRRGQEPDRAGDALHLWGQHEHHQHSEGGEQPVQPRRPGEQAADGG